MAMRKSLLLNALFWTIARKAVDAAPFVLELKTSVSQLQRYGSDTRNFRQGRRCSDLSQIRGGDSGVGIIESVAEVKEHAQQTASKFNFALNQPGDGHEEEPFIPRRFIRMQKGNVDKAKAAYNATLSWRATNDVDSILGKPHPTFDVFKKVLPNFFCGPDTTGHVIFCQRPGFLRMELLTPNNVTEQGLILHYVYILEYCWNLLESRPDHTMTSILDGKDLKLVTVRKLFTFINEFVSMMSHHYPQRSYKTLIINAPSWAGMIYKLISPLLRESTRNKISILNGGTRQEKVLKEILGEVPSELSESGTYKGCNSAFEQEMRAFVVARLQEGGMEMQIVREP